VRRWNRGSSRTAPLFWSPTLIACMSWPSSSSPICGELEDLRLEFQLSSKNPRARLDIRRKQLLRRFQAAAVAYRRASRIGLRLGHPCLCTVHSAHDMGPPSYSCEYQPASTVLRTVYFLHDQILFPVREHPEFQPEVSQNTKTPSVPRLRIH
jgi:hypothetical protein